MAYAGDMADMSGMEHHHMSTNVKEAATAVVTLKASMADGKMVYLDEHGKANPTLHAKVGDVVEVHLSVDAAVMHDFAVPDLHVHSAHAGKPGEVVVVRFKADKAGTFDYYCTLPGHREAGMAGKLVVVAAGAEHSAHAH